VTFLYYWKLSYVGVLTISRDEILHQIKLSCQIPLLSKVFLLARLCAAEEAGIKAEPEEELQQGRTACG